MLICCSLNALFAQATAGEYDLLLAQKRINILAQTKFGRINKLLTFANVGVDVNCALGTKFSLRGEAALGRANLFEFGGMYHYRNEIVNQAMVIFKHPESHPEHTNQNHKQEKIDDEIVAYTNKHKLRGIRVGAYQISVATSVFEIDDLGFGGSTMTKDGTIGFVQNVKGLPTFRYQSYGVYAGWSIYNSVNYTDAAHRSGFSTFGRHNDYFSINFDVLAGQSTLNLTESAKSSGYKLVDKKLDYNGIPVGGRASFEIGVKNVKQIFSFDANLEIAKYPYHRYMTLIVGLGVRVSLFDNILSNESGQF